LGRIQAINARIKLWDGIYNELLSISNTNWYQE
jgi:hypothetical protein